MMMPQGNWQAQQQLQQVSETEGHAQPEKIDDRLGRSKGWNHAHVEVVARRARHMIFAIYFRRRPRG